MSRVLIPVILLCNGVGVGVMLSTVIGIVPLTLTQQYEPYVRTIQFLWPRYDPFMPIMNGTAFALDVVLAAWPGEPARAFFGVAAASLLAVMGISVAKNVPINKYVTSLDPQVMPPDWAALDPRMTWRRWNFTRTMLALLALAVNVVGAAALL